MNWHPIQQKNNKFINNFLLTVYLKIKKFTILVSISPLSMEGALSKKRGSVRAREEGGLVKKIESLGIS